jgi:hypothetical protein
MFIIRNLPPKIFGSVLTCAALFYRGVERRVKIQGSVHWSDLTARITDLSEFPQDEPEANSKETF